MADQPTESIISAAIEVHKTLGPGLLEAIDEAALCHEFDLVGIDFQRQIAVDVIYKGHVIQGQRLDLLVKNEVGIEIKSLRTLPDIATSQLLSYLKATKETLIKSHLSFPRRREPSRIKQLDPRLRGDDDLIRVSLI